MCTAFIEAKVAIDGKHVDLQSIPITNIESAFPNIVFQPNIFQ